MRQDKRSLEALRGEYLDTMEGYEAGEVSIFSVISVIARYNLTSPRAYGKAVRERLTIGGSE
tara:strand:+ start:800 stop:985 length:186 start_codon:yes stop_codon:yes gene_type:complete